MTDKIDFNFSELRGEIGDSPVIRCLTALDNGPKEVSDLIQEAVKHRFLEEPPEEFLQMVRNLRPLSRKFIANTAQEAGSPMIDNDLTRSLGFFGDWTPQ
jgi:hypothetical protein